MKLTANWRQYCLAGRFRFFLQTFDKIFTFLRKIGSVPFKDNLVKSLTMGCESYLPEFQASMSSKASKSAQIWLDSCPDRATR
jgi:hypothetical protein